MKLHASGCLATPGRVALATFHRRTLALALTKLAVHHFDASYFVMAGERFSIGGRRPRRSPYRAKMGSSRRGYDGQILLFDSPSIHSRIGLSNSHRPRSSFLPTPTNPEFVHRSFSWSFGGQPKVVLYDFIALDLAGAAALAWFSHGWPNSEMRTPVGARGCGLVRDS